MGKKLTKKGTWDWWILDDYIGSHLRWQGKMILIDQWYWYFVKGIAVVAEKVILAYSPICSNRAYLARLKEKSFLKYLFPTFANIYIYIF